jgi:hypothetical protein
MTTDLAIAQTPQQNILAPRAVQLIFNQNLNIYDWLYGLNFQKSFGNGIDFKIREEFRSTLQRTSTDDLWKDNQSLVVNLSYPLANVSKVNARMFSHILSDPLARFDNDVSFYAGSLGVSFQPRSNFYVSTNVSSKWQSQLARSDQGFGYDLTAQLSDAVLDDYQNDFFFTGGQDFFPLRRNEDLKIRYEIKRQFYHATADTLTVFFDRLRRDNFDIAGGNYFVRKLTQTTRGVKNHLSYRIAAGATLFFTNYLASNTFRVDNIIDGDSAEVSKDDAGFESRHSAHFFWQRENWFNSLGWNFNLRTRDDRRVSSEPPDPFGRHPSLGFDTDETFVRLEWSSGLRVASRDSLGWFAAVSKFKYDTSDTLAPNNHDQLRWQMTLSHQHRFSWGLKLLWRGSVFLNHLVYISGRFSSGNNWERVVQLTPTILYEPSSVFKLQQNFTVRAKYQTYDFDDPITSTRNIANRQFITSSACTLTPTDRTKVEFSASLELAEQGKFFYNNWRQQLALSWLSQDLLLLIKRQLASALQLSIGGSLFHQARWNHRFSSQGSLTKTLRDKHTNVGPILEMAFRPSPSLEVAFYGNMQVVYSSQRRTERINRFDLNLHWFF